MEKVYIFCDEFGTSTLKKNDVKKREIGESKVYGETNNAWQRRWEAP